ncbi:MAG: hypothetical protein DMF60_16945 [Acidobacteria bacterium]|nr:MAG: hypothetical protein DMF60_16945 [Acidobacteriota bacterium]
MSNGSSLFITAVLSALAACSAGTPVPSANSSPDANKSANPSSLQQTESRPPNTARIIHVLVALCDNEHQGIVPVPARLGNGEDLQGNLYWGAAYGVRSFFAKSGDWKLIVQTQNPTSVVLERCIFHNKMGGAYMIADAYRGAEIKKAIVDFFDYASGNKIDTIDAEGNSKHPTINAGGAADLVVFVGHNGLMDFVLPSHPAQKDGKRRGAIILCCASKSYFSAPLRKAGANPILWTALEKNSFDQSLRGSRRKGNDRY